MEWKLRGWLWYIQGAIFRRFGANRNIISTLSLIIGCVVFLCVFQIDVFRGQGETDLRNFKRTLGYEGQQLTHEEIPDYKGVDELPKSPLKKKKNAGRNNKSKMKGKRKGFNPRAIDKGSIGIRKDKLMFPRIKGAKDKKNPSVIESKHKPKTYQEDVIVGDNVEWTLEREQERRRELRQRSLRTRRECENDTRGRLNRRIEKIYEHLKWVDTYELVYCPVFKAASTTWMKNLLFLSEKTNLNGSLHHKVSSLYPAPSSHQRIEKLLDRSLKFMIVRHPFERLLSAYRDKLLRVLKVEDPYRQLQLRIMANYGDVGSKNTSKLATKRDPLPSSSDAVKETDHPSFLQFLHKVRDEMQFFWKVMDGTLVDPHWTPYWYSCAPCQIRYDIIAKVETLDLDQEFIIRAANLFGTLPNTRTHASKNDGYSDSDSASAEYFKTIPVGLLKELENLYWPDFKLFGYTAEKYLKMAMSGA